MGSRRRYQDTFSVILHSHLRPDIWLYCPYVQGASALHHNEYRSKEGPRAFQMTAGCVANVPSFAALLSSAVLGSRGVEALTRAERSRPVPGPVLLRKKTLEKILCVGLGIFPNAG